MTYQNQNRVINALRKAMESMTPPPDGGSGKENHKGGETDHLADFANLLEGMVDEMPVSDNEAFLLGAAARRARRESERRNFAIARARAYCMECGCKLEYGHLPDCTEFYYPESFDTRNEEPGIARNDERKRCHVPKQGFSRWHPPHLSPLSTADPSDLPPSNDVHERGGGCLFENY